MITVDIKEVSLNDLPLLQEISRQTFTETFFEHNTPENMKKYLEERFSEKKLSAELSNPESEFYFALCENRVIGYLKLNTGAAQTEPLSGNVLEIERIYVLKEFHGKNAGLILFEKALQRGAERKSEYIWLGVWEKNLRAIRFYTKNGFIESGRHIFRLGDEEQTDIIMKRIL